MCNFSIIFLVNICVPLSVIQCQTVKNDGGLSLQGIPSPSQALIQADFAFQDTSIVEVGISSVVEHKGQRKCN